MKKIILLVFLSYSTLSFSQADRVVVENSNSHFKLKVNGSDFIINGMNWDYFPVGTNYSYSLWNQPDAFIQQALDDEMGLLQNMGVNTIRVYSGIPKKWIEYIHAKFGIYTMLNHSFGRYGLTIDGVWKPNTEYSDTKTRKLLLNEVTQMAKEYKDTKGLLLFLLGNENNYGLFWQGAETEDFPDDEQEKAFIGENRGRPMYRLMNEAAKRMKAADNSRPVAICNGDVLFIDIIAEECKDVDVFGTNMYRGPSFTDAFKIVKEKLDMPIMLTEFGADAFNALNNAEDQKMQAYYMVSNWKDIYGNAAGLGKSENAIGGFTFQFSDGWWKYDFDNRKNVSKHDTVSTWANGGYPSDLLMGENNMNEEWFGICAKGPTNNNGLYNLYPRAAYYALKQIHQFDPHNEGINVRLLQKYFHDIDLKL